MAKMNQETYFQCKPWIRNVVCKTCYEHLRQWKQGKRNSLKFGIPMIWREPKNHVDDCYFCKVNIIGINRNNRKNWAYPNLDSAKRPLAHSKEDIQSSSAFQLDPNYIFVVEDEQLSEENSKEDESDEDFKTSAGQKSFFQSE